MADANDTVTLMSTTPEAELPSNRTSEEMTFHYFTWVFLMPVVVLVGIIGNALSIAVLRSKDFRSTTTGVYLPLTAVADMLFLLTGALEILEVADVFNAREYNVWACRVYKVLHYTAGDVSIWLLVAFTFDRFIAVCFPLSKRRVCTRKRAAIVSAAVLVLFLGKNLHEFWTRGPVYHDNGQLRRVCGSQQRYRFFLYYVRPWIVFGLITALPFVLIFFFNCMIVHSLIKAQKTRSKAAAIPASGTGTGNKRITPPGTGIVTGTGTKTGTGAGTGPGTGNKLVTLSEAGSQAGTGAKTGTGTGNKPPTSVPGFRQTTFMCLGISFAFLVLISPSIVVLIGKPYWKQSSYKAYKIVKAISNFLCHVNHCINFFLYCVTGRRFRQKLRTLLTCSHDDGFLSELTSQPR